MKQLICMWLIGTLFAAEAMAKELQVRIDSQYISASVRDISLPPSLVKDLQSGIQNKILVRILVTSGKESLAHVDITIEAKYDLWDERFTIRTRRGEQLIEDTTLDTVTAVMARLDPIDLPRLFPVAAFPQNRSLIMQADVLINPVEREKMERLREWVANNSAPGSATGVGNATLSSKPNDLFNAIFEQYVRGSDMVAPWSVSVLSEPFELSQTRSGSPPR